MDFFTHMFVGYLATMWLGLGTSGAIPEPVLLFGVIMGGSPDFDVLLLPLWRRYPMTRHHGITHSLLFMLGAPAVGGGIAAVLFGMPIVLLYFVGVLAVGTHLICDWFTNFEIPLLLPFVRKGYTFGAENAINPYLMGWTVVSMFVLWGFRGVLDPARYYLALQLTSALFLGYCAVRAALKLGLQRRYASAGRSVNAIGAISPFTWYLEERLVLSGVKVTRYVRVNLLAGTSEARFFEVDRMATGLPIEAPITSPEQALLAASSHIGLMAADLQDLAATVQRTAEAWEVIWFRWGALPNPRRTRLSMTVDDQGNVAMGSSDLRVRWN